MTQRDTLELAIIADVHYVCRTEHICSILERNAHLGRELLQRALRRIQLSGAPDALVLMGDLVDNGKAPGAEHDLAALKEELENVGVPTIVVPGNHDGAPERLFRIFGDRPGSHEVKGYLLITFADRYDSDDRAERSREGLALVRDVASSHPGVPLIVFQHNPVYPPIESSYPYNLTNASEVMKVYSENGVVLSVSGHLHSGHKLICADGVGYIICPALCEDPFRFLRIKVRGGEVSVQEEALKMPKEPPLVDVHVHTQYAYCATTVTAQGAIERARKLGLSGIVLTEHAGHLYVSPEDSGRIIEKPQLLRRYRSEGRDRMRAYRKEMEALRSSFVRLGLEVECDRFMMVTEKLLQQGVKVLAHPFRFFRRRGMEVPKHLFKPVAEMLAKYKMAAELNFHTNEPDPEFFRLCLEEGVPIALGSDAHALYEVGEFAPHIEFLRKLAVGSNLKNILFYS